MLLRVTQAKFGESSIAKVSEVFALKILPFLFKKNQQETSSRSIAEEQQCWGASCHICCAIGFSHLMSPAAICAGSGVTYHPINGRSKKHRSHLCSYHSGPGFWLRINHFSSPNRQKAKLKFLSSQFGLGSWKSSSQWMTSTRKGQKGRMAAVAVNLPAAAKESQHGKRQKCYLLSFY